MTHGEIAALKPGDQVRWVTQTPRWAYPRPFHHVLTLSHRKEDGTGWWNTDGTGLSDELALATDRWELVR